MSRSVTVVIWLVLALISCLTFSFEWSQPSLTHLSPVFELTFEVIIDGQWLTIEETMSEVGTELQCGKRISNMELFTPQLSTKDSTSDDTVEICTRDD